ncbi:MAG: TatD family hydrolase [Deltaproteobacteria bacterium]|nr:TatD family hydrolase [Deltaproteobacteria bacterium]
MLIDSHAHLDMPEFDKDRNEVIQRAHDCGIEYIITVGIDVDSCRHAIRLAEEFESVYAIVGIHPHNVKDIDGGTYDILRKLTQHEKVCALGEMGLDFFRNHSPRDIQLTRFREQIALAKELELPMVVHDRNAHRETLAILKEEKAFEVGGVIHCFSGDYEMASKCLNMGFYISIPGTITFKNAKSLQELVRSIPLDRILLETDSPFLAPMTFRGKRNEPSYVRYVADKIAKLKKLDFEEVASVTSQNVKTLFRIPT